MSEISKSKQKRMQQENARKEQRKQKATRTFILILIPVVIVAAIVAGVLYYKSLQVNYEKGLDNDGKIAGINMASTIQTDLNSFTFSKSEMMPDEYQIEDDIDRIIKEHGQLNTDSSRVAEYGDTVKVTYTAILNGEVYEEETEGRDMTLGDSYISAEVDGALEGQTTGGTVTVPVSYDADYYDETLAGNSVTYTVTVTGIYDYPEFDDEFVLANLGSDATTADGYREYITNKYYKENLESAIDDAISINSVVLDYPQAYLDNTEKIIKAQDKETFGYYAQMYAAYGMSMSNVYELYGLDSQEAYDEEVAKNAKEMVAKSLFLQYVYETAGLTNTEDDVKEFYLSEGYDEATYSQSIKQFGYKYMANQALQARAMDYLVDNVTVTD